jgi:hypothetical protein
LQFQFLDTYLKIRIKMRSRSSVSDCAGSRILQYFICLPDLLALESVHGHRLPIGSARSNHLYPSAHPFFPVGAQKVDDPAIPKPGSKGIKRHQNFVRIYAKTGKYNAWLKSSQATFKRLSSGGSRLMTIHASNLHLEFSFEICSSIPQIVVVVILIKRVSGPATGTGFSSLAIYPGRRSATASMRGHDGILNTPRVIRIVQYSGKPSKPKVRFS